MQDDPLEHDPRYENRDRRIAEAKLAPAWLIVVCIVGIILAVAML